MVWLVAVILAIVFWKRQRTVSLFVLIALSIFFVLSITDVLFAAWITLQGTRMGLAAQQIASYYAVKSIVRELCSAVGWALLIAAVFGWRKGSSPTDTSQPQVKP
jgi:hypothetical protein